MIEINVTDLAELIEEVRKTAFTNGLTKGRKLGKRQDKERVEYFNPSMEDALKISISAGKEIPSSYTYIENKIDESFEPNSDFEPYSRVALLSEVETLHKEILELKKDNEGLKEVLDAAQKSVKKWRSKYKEAKGKVDSALDIAKGFSKNSI